MRVLCCEVSLARRYRVVAPTDYWVIIITGAPSMRFCIYGCAMSSVCSSSLLSFRQHCSTLCLALTQRKKSIETPELTRRGTCNWWPVWTSKVKRSMSIININTSLHLHVCAIHQLHHGAVLLFHVLLCSSFSFCSFFSRRSYCNIDFFGIWGPKTLCLS